MSTPPSLRLRKNILDLDDREKRLLLKAWDWIKIQSPRNDDGSPNRNSFFTIAGYHGQPFRGAGWGNPAWWGGYCNHGNVLFST
jgi:tyrosinase